MSGLSDTDTHHTRSTFLHSGIFFVELGARLTGTMANATSGRNGPHDVGGTALLPPQLTVIDRSIHELADWEVRVDALLHVITRKGWMQVHQLRRGIESLDPAAYSTFSYYSKWATSVTIALLERGTITQAEFDAKFGLPPTDHQAVSFRAGDRVQVRGEDFATRWRKPHLRTPGYIFGARGVIERYCGDFDNPEILAFPFGRKADDPAVKAPLYRVRFRQVDIWPHYRGSANDTIEVEMYQQWLVSDSTGAGAASSQVKDEKAGSLEPDAKKPRVDDEAHDASYDHSHSHHQQHHGDDHVHQDRDKVEQTAVHREGEPDPGERVARALLATLFDKGIVTPEEIRQAIEVRESLGQEMRGLDVVVRAWQDASFRQRLMESGNEAVKELGIDMDAKLVVVENTDSLRNVVVCTLCSCYPTQLLGRPPAWYKSRSYRARMPFEPRVVLTEFGSIVSEQCEVRVHDSSADCRYMVLPQRPEGTNGWSDDALRELLSRDVLVGVAVATAQKV